MKASSSEDLSNIQQTLEQTFNINPLILCSFIGSFSDN